MNGLTFATGYGYNNNGQLSTVVYPVTGRVLSYNPDAFGRPTTASGFVSSLSYFPSGQLQQVNYTNGAMSAYGQNNRLWPNSFTAYKAGTIYINNGYGYDATGNLLSVVDTVDSTYNRTLAYDGIARVTSATGPWGTGSISYDGGGNITNQSLGSFGINYAYNSANLLTSTTGSKNGTYTYDSAGNLTGDGTNTFSYDGASNLVCSNCSNTTQRTDYGYDGLNQRLWVQKVSTAGSTYKTYEIYSSNGQLMLEHTRNKAAPP